MEIIFIVSLSVLGLFALLTTVAVMMWLANRVKSAVGLGSRPDAGRFEGTNRTIPGKGSRRTD